MVAVLNLNCHFVVIGVFHDGKRKSCALQPLRRSIGVGEQNLWASCPGEAKDSLVQIENAADGGGERLVCLHDLDKLVVDLGCKFGGVRQKLVVSIPQ